VRRAGAIALALALAAGACSTPRGAVGSGYRKVVETLSDPPTKLDVLFVIDDSGSTTDDQRALVDAARTELFPQLETMDGTLPDLHVAVVSTGVSLPGSGLTFCDDAYYSLPDGRFLRGPWQPSGAPTCPGISGAFLSDAPDGAGGRTTNFTGTLEDNFACIAQLGNVGCGIEQPLEAMHRALSGEHPENDGFLRDDALLLVVFLGDEDDSSFVDGSVIQASDDPFVLNDREFEYGVICDPDDASVGPRTGCVPRDNPAVIHGIDEYVDFLTSLKADPSLVMVAGITSPPGPVAIIPGTLPEHSSQVELDGACTPPPGPCAYDPTMTCPRGPVKPAVRLDAFLSDFPARYVLSSMCEDDMPTRVRRVAHATRGVMTNDGCLLGTANIQAASCAAYDVEPDGARTRLPLTIGRDDATCDYTPTHLRATLPVTPAGHHLEVDCAS
jgi:hypothetical protein